MEAKQQKMLDFLLEKMGISQDELEEQLHGQFLNDMIKANSTLGEILDKAEDAGVLDEVREMNITDIISRFKSKEAKTKGSRLTKEEGERLTESILVYLKKVPNSGIGDIANAVGYDTKKVRGQLMKLKKENKVVSKGELKNTTYKLK